MSSSREEKSPKGGWIESAPEFCPVGHPLGPNRVLVGSTVCHCKYGRHRTHRCRQCDGVVYTPPHTDACTVSDGGRSTFDWTSSPPRNT